MRHDVNTPHPATPVSRAQQIAAWLSSYGLSFNPFTYAESERDRRLEEYYVEHPAFEQVREASHTFIYANPGGGKTATRLRLESYYRNFFLIDRIFAVPHVIQEAAGAMPPRALGEHVPHILVSAAQHAFLLLAQFGGQLPGLRDPRIARRFAAFFDACYPTRAWRDDLADAERTDCLRQALSSLALPYDEDAAPAAPGSVDRQWIRDWLALLSAEQQADIAESKPTLDIAGWLEFRRLMLAAGANAIVILVDGVDAGAGRAPLAGMLAVVEPLAQAMADGSLGQEVFLKLFLPLKVRGGIGSGLRANIGEHIITWQDSSLLRNLLERRLTTASQGVVRSFAQLVEPGVDISALEGCLFQAAGGSPRRLIGLVNRLFAAHVGRGGASQGHGRVARRTVEAFEAQLQESDVTT
jgi:hypothetical protein